MKWNVDVDIARLEAMLNFQDSPGTQVVRVLVDRNTLQSLNMTCPIGSGTEHFFIWCLRLARMGAPRYVEAYGFTIKQAYLKALKMIKSVLNKKRTEQRKKLGLKPPKKKEKRRRGKKSEDGT